ncbi:MAG TPA: DUF222 domain-containing protein [Mycobacterium sp.]
MDSDADFLSAHMIEYFAQLPEVTTDAPVPPPSDQEFAADLLERGADEAVVVLASLDPGPRTAALIAQLNPSSLSPRAMVSVISATEKLASWVQARQHRWLAAFACPGIAAPTGALKEYASQPGQPLHDGGAKTGLDRLDGMTDLTSSGSAVHGDPAIDTVLEEVAIKVAAAEVGAALRLSPIAASRRVCQAVDFAIELPATLRALEAGTIDRARSLTIAERTQDLPTELRRRVERAVLPKAVARTPGQVRGIVDRAVISVDPEAAKKRHERALSERNVGCRPGEDGIGIFQAQLAADRAQVAFGVIDQLAYQLKRNRDQASDTRGIGALRADVFGDLFDQLATTGTVTIRKTLQHRANGEGTNISPRQSGEQPHPQAGTPAGNEGSPAGPPNQATAASFPDAGAEPSFPDAGAEPATNSTSQGCAGPNTPTSDTDIEPVDDAAHGKDIDYIYGGLPHAQNAPGSVERAESIPPQKFPMPIRQHRVEENTTDRQQDGADAYSHPLLHEHACGCRPPNEWSDTAWGTHHGRLTHLNVTIARSTLFGDDDRPGELEGHGAIPADLARAIATSAETITAIAIDPSCGTGLDLGRTSYRPRLAQRDHVTTRDQTCRFVGCRQPARRCQLDHSNEFCPGKSDGGVTCPCNLVCLCQFHHGLKTGGLWDTEQLKDGTVIWTSPTGRTYETQPRQWPTETDDAPVRPPRPAENADDEGGIIETYNSPDAARSAEQVEASRSGHSAEAISARQSATPAGPLGPSESTSFAEPSRPTRERDPRRTPRPEPEPDPRRTPGPRESTSSAEPSGPRENAAAAETPRDNGHSDDDLPPF